MKNSFLLTVFLFSGATVSASSFKDCVKLGLSEIQCYQVGEGFSDCLADKQPTSVCLNAKMGYKDCRADKLQPSQCLNVNGNYKDCREKKEANFCAAITSN